MRFKVIKADGSIEQYFHTKVIGAICNALGQVGQADICVAEELAEVVTYYLYHKQNVCNVTSNEILSMIKVVLAATNYEEAAIVLSEYHCQRRLRRSRTEVIDIDICGLTDAQKLCKTEKTGRRNRWDKSIIAADLMADYDLCRHTARTIAAMVEEKIFAMQITQVPGSLIKQLVLSDTAAVMRAQGELQTA